jgi:hypothetical protein
MTTDGPPIPAGDPPRAVRPAPPSPGGPRRRSLLDLMAAVATCSLLFAAHRPLLDVLVAETVRNTATLATGMLPILYAGHVGLTALGRRHNWRGLNESRYFVRVMILVIGLMAAAFSSLESPAAGTLYLAATLVILTYAMRRR